MKEYLENLQETNSITPETTDSGLWSQCAPSEPELYKGTGNVIVMSCYLLEWIPREYWLAIVKSVASFC